MAIKEFTDFIMVDWSARNKAITGENSVWIAHNDKEPLNPSTRKESFEHLKSILTEISKDKNRRALCGFDFCFGLPHGAVDTLREKTGDDSSTENWQWLWKYLDKKIKDDEKNRNNRFQVASKMNEIMSGGKGPFWGCPKKRSNKYLSATRDKFITGEMFKEKRMTESGGTEQSVWKLYNDASVVGSQSLLGMAYLNRLRLCKELKEHIKIHPFENCDSAPIVFAEIYFSQSSIRVDPNIFPKDKGQVMAAVELCRSLQYEGELQNFLLRPKCSKISQDEGWTFTKPMPPHIETY